MTREPAALFGAGDIARELEQGVSLARVLDVFDALPAASVGDMPGRWAGAEVPPGHVLDGLLAAYGWHGKSFISAEEADPLVFGEVGDLFPVQPAAVPVRLALKFPGLVRHRAIAAAGRAGLPLLRTRRPRARLRMVEYRGVSTATMIYDAKPINDHFRRVDEATLLGAMDMRGLDDPFFFLLRRDEGAPA